VQKVRKPLPTQSKAYHKYYDLLRPNNEMGGNGMITEEEYEELEAALNREYRRLSLALDILSSSDLIDRYYQELKEMEE